MKKILIIAAMLLQLPAFAQTLNPHIIDGVFSIKLPASNVPDWESTPNPGTDYFEIEGSGLLVRLKKRPVPNPSHLDSLFISGYISGSHYWMENTSIKPKEKSMNIQGKHLRVVEYTKEKNQHVAEAFFILNTTLYVVEAVAHREASNQAIESDVIQSIQIIQKN